MVPLTTTAGFRINEPVPAFANGPAGVTGTLISSPSSDAPETVMVLFGRASAELVPEIVGVNDRLSFVAVIPFVRVSTPLRSEAVGAALPPPLLKVRLASVFAPIKLSTPPPFIVTSPVAAICCGLPKLRLLTPAVTPVPLVMVTVLLFGFIPVMNSPVGIPAPTTAMPTDSPVTLLSETVLEFAAVDPATVATSDAVALLIVRFPGITVDPVRPARSSVPWFTKVPPV